MWGRFATTTIELVSMCIIRFAPELINILRSFKMLLFSLYFSDLHPLVSASPRNTAL